MNFDGVYENFSAFQVFIYNRNTFIVLQQQKLLLESVNLEINAWGKLFANLH